MWLSELRRNSHPGDRAGNSQQTLSGEALQRASRVMAEQAEALAEEIDLNPLLVDNPADALRLFASLIRDSAAVALEATAGQA